MIDDWWCWQEQHLSVFIASLSLSPRRLRFSSDSMYLCSTDVIQLINVLIDLPFLYMLSRRWMFYQICYLYTWYPKFQYFLKFDLHLSLTSPMRPAFSTLEWAWWSKLSSSSSSAWDLEWSIPFHCFMMPNNTSSHHHHHHDSDNRHCQVAWSEQ